MTKNTRKRNPEKRIESRPCLAILTLVTEMARCLNENISKVQLKPLDTELLSAATPRSVLAGVDTTTA